MPADSARRPRLRTGLVALSLALAAPVVTNLAPPAASATTFGQSVVDRASTYYGAPYSWGATGPSSFDCSGFVGFIYRSFGVNLPRTAAQQYAAIPHVAQDQKQVGDLVFTYDSGGIYHVGIYAGGNQVWAATHTGDVVRPQTIWTSSYVVGRPVAPGPVVPGDIGKHWSALGGSAGFLGQPLGDEHAVPGGRAVDFSGGRVYWSPPTGAREVHGEIGAAYDRRGATASSLGFPVSDEAGTPDGVGRYNTFAGGSLYFSPWTGAHVVQGEIRNAWGARGFESGPAGYPVSDELRTPDGVGRFNVFTGGSIYWTPATGGHLVKGDIRAAWGANGWETGPGYPITDEVRTPDGQGAFTVFSRSASIYWSPATGAHVVKSGIRDKWAALGYEAGVAGYPVTDEKVTPDGAGRYNDFSKGVSIYWSPTSGAHAVDARTRDQWQRLGASAGRLGYPVTDTRAVPGGVQTEFERGSITWQSATGSFKVLPEA